MTFFSFYARKGVKKMVFKRNDQMIKQWFEFKGCGLLLFLIYSLREKQNMPYTDIVNYLKVRRCISNRLN